MLHIYLIAKNTFKEIIYDKIFYALIGFSIFILGLSLALGQLTFAEQSRISVNFGFTAVHLSTAILSILFASQLIYKEIDRKTIMSLLARPISVETFLLGKVLGLIGLSLSLLFALYIIICLIVLGFGLEFNHLLALGFMGIALESLVLICLCVFLSAISRPALVISYGVLLFLIGHWLGSLDYFAQNSDTLWFKTLASGIVYVIPDLEQFNWRSNFLYGEFITWTYFFKTVLYAISWSVFFLIAASFIFKRRDLV